MRSRYVTTLMVTSSLLLSACINTPSTNTGSMVAIDKAVSSTLRPQEDIDRDAMRNPRAILSFFGIQPGQTVLDLNAGSGYYTRLLSEVVGAEGSVVAHADTFFVNFGDPAVLAEALPNVDALSPIPVTQLTSVETYDRILAINAIHDLSVTHPQVRPQPVDPDLAFNALYSSLKSGGILGIVDHAGPEGMGFDVSGQTHRISPEVLIATASKAGFVLEDRSMVLTNSDDPMTAPPFDPSVAGRTNRTVLRFRKI